MKRLTALFLTLVLCMGLSSFSTSAQTAEDASAVETKATGSGTWGELGWALDASGTLTISGNGSMNSLYSGDAWRNSAYSSSIRGDNCEYYSKTESYPPHIYDNDSDNYCNLCGEERAVNILPGDINGDDVVNSLDAAQILKFDSGLITEF